MNCFNYALAMLHSKFEIPILRIEVGTGDLEGLASRNYEKYLQTNY